MKNKVVGYIIIGIALLIGFIIFSFNRALTEIVSSACVHGSSCPMWGTLSFQTNIGIGIMAFVVLIGLYLVFFGKEERIIAPAIRELKPVKVSRENYQEIIKEMDEDEKQLFEEILKAEGTIFQSDLVEKTGLNKVKVTRILDRLEGRGLVERRRRGMTNVVILKHSLRENGQED
jgi:predicted transcriptional regulator/TM2 domain-containing membrane protein YozV